VVVLSRQEEEFISGGARGFFESILDQLELDSMDLLRKELVAW
jgi:hypothetical protein